MAWSDPPPGWGGSVTPRSKMFALGKWNFPKFSGFFLKEVHKTKFLGFLKFGKNRKGWWLGVDVYWASGRVAFWEVNFRCALPTNPWSPISRARDVSVRGMTQFFCQTRFLEWLSVQFRWMLSFLGKNSLYFPPPKNSPKFSHFPLLVSWLILLYPLLAKWLKIDGLFSYHCLAFKRTDWFLALDIQGMCQPAKPNAINCPKISSHSCTCPKSNPENLCNKIVRLQNLVRTGWKPRRPRFLWNQNISSLFCEKEYLKDPLPKSFVRLCGTPWWSEMIFNE